jgi:hypothetical protein
MPARGAIRGLLLGLRLGWGKQVSQLRSQTMVRNIAITLVAIAQFAISALSLVSGITLLLLMTGQIQVFSSDLTNLASYFKGLILLGLLISLWGLVSSYGLWQLKRWGWLGSLVFQVLCMVNNGLIVLGGRQFTFGVYFSLGISGALLFVLLLPSTRRLLQTPDTSAAAAQN